MLVVGNPARPIPESIDVHRIGDQAAALLEPRDRQRLGVGTIGGRRVVELAGVQRDQPEGPPTQPFHPDRETAPGFVPDVAGAIGREGLRKSPPVTWK